MNKLLTFIPKAHLINRLEASKMERKLTIATPEEVAFFNKGNHKPNKDVLNKKSLDDLFFEELMKGPNRSFGRRNKVDGFDFWKSTLTLDFYKTLGEQNDVNWKKTLGVPPKTSGIYFATNADYPAGKALHIPRVYSTELGWSKRDLTTPMANKKDEDNISYYVVPMATTEEEFNLLFHTF